MACTAGDVLHAGDDRGEGGVGVDARERVRRRWFPTVAVAVLGDLDAEFGGDLGQHLAGLSDLVGRDVQPVRGHRVVGRRRLDVGRHVPQA